MKKVLFKIAAAIMNFIYFFMKLRRTKNRVTFISRQSDNNSLDFELIQKKLKEENPNIEIISLNKRFRDTDTFSMKFKYIFHILKQMHYISTSKVVVLETYCIPISMLKHKKTLKVIQMWHALGSLKKFGYSITTKEEGSKLSGIMKMHKNYDYILTSSAFCRKNFAEAFGYDESNLKVLPLPRIDYLMDENVKSENLKKINDKYHLKKKVILYAPTFRKFGEDIDKIRELIRVVDYNKYDLVLKLHPLTLIDINDARPIVDKSFPTIDWLHRADYIISDYSAIVYEAAFVLKPLFFYVYDFDKYEKDRDFYIDYMKEMPGVIKKDAKDIVKAIETDEYDIEKVKEFSKKSIDYHNQDCTLELAKLILNNVK